MTHHPHIHMFVRGGGLSLDGRHWVASRRAFLLPVCVLGSLFRRLLLARLIDLHEAGALQFYGEHVGFSDRHAFPPPSRAGPEGALDRYAKPFAAPEAVLAYLSRYTHRVAISSRRLLAFDETGVTFRYRDYRDGADGHRTNDATRR